MIAINLLLGCVRSQNIVSALFLVCISNLTLASNLCDKQDKSFADFLEKFEENSFFQQQRILFPLVYREGEYQSVNYKIDLWNLEKIKGLSFPLIYSIKERKEENISETILLQSKNYIELYQNGPPESDLYRLLYKFRKIQGCWFLEELHDKST